MGVAAYIVASQDETDLGLGTMVIEDGPYFAKDIAEAEYLAKRRAEDLGQPVKVFKVVEVAHYRPRGK